MFRSLYGPLVRRLTGLMGDRVAAEDVAQEAFMKLLSNPPREERNLAGWLHMVATRLAYNHLRGERRRREREHRTALHGDGAIDDPTAVGEVIAGAVHDALRLPERDRLALIMRFHGYRYAEIATALGVEPASVGTMPRPGSGGNTKERGRTDDDLWRRGPVDGLS